MFRGSVGLTLKICCIYMTENLYVFKYGEKQVASY